MEGVHRQATLLFVLNSKLYQEILPPSWKCSETEVVYASYHLRRTFLTPTSKALRFVNSTR